MMNNVVVYKNGCVKLGNYVSCDGYHPECLVRVQSHFHQDHLGDLRKSKLRQKLIICTEQTKSFLSLVYPDIPVRRNQFLAFPADGRYRQIDAVRIALHNTNHMPGSAMVEVIEPDGSKYAYTSDLSTNPASLPSRPDVLVLDPTHGDPMRAHRFSFDEVAEQLIREVGDAFKDYSVVSLVSHTSNLFRALRLLSDEYKYPFCIGGRLESFVEPFRRAESIEVDHFRFGSDEYHRKRTFGEPFFMLVDRQDNGMMYASEGTVRFHLWASNGTKRVPIRKDGKEYYCAFSEHADFESIIEIISRIEPKQVIVDESRSPVGGKLARAIRERLNVNAYAEARIASPEEFS